VAAQAACQREWMAQRWNIDRRAKDALLDGYGGREQKPEKMDRGANPVEFFHVLWMRDHCLVAIAQTCGEEFHFCGNGGSPSLEGSSG